MRSPSLLSAAFAVLAASGSAQDHAYGISATAPPLLYGVDLGLPSFRTIGQLSGSLGFPRGLAWRSRARELWTYDVNGSELGVVSPVTLAFTPSRTIGFSPPRNVLSIAWEPTSDRIVIGDHDNTTQRSTLTSYTPTTGNVATLASWVGTCPPIDFAFDAQGNAWFLCGLPFGLYVLEPGQPAPRWVVTLTAFACNLAIERASGTFYVLAGTTPPVLARVDPATGSMVLIGSIFGCLQGFDVVEGACHVGLSTYGVGCPGSGSFIPELSARGCYNANGFVHLGIGYAPSGSMAVLLFGLTPASMPMGYGCSLLVSSVFTAPQFVLPLFGSGGAGRGFTTVGFSIPPDVVTSSFVAQAFVLDPQAPLGFTVTNGVRLD